jgi:membrane protein DedA with SNARE-associated domain
MVSMPVVIQAFDPSAAVAVIIVAMVVGYIVGYAFARIANWNQIHRV